MMDILGRYIDELKAELVIDDMNVSEVQKRLPARRHFWVSRLINHKRELMKCKKEMSDTELVLANNYVATSPTRVSIVEAIRIVKTSEPIKNLKEKCEELELVIEFLERTEKNLDKMTWDIKNIVELMKMELL